MRTFLATASAGLLHSAEQPIIDIHQHTNYSGRTDAELIAHQRTFIPIGWSLQRAEHGEQPYWAATVLMAMLGQFGLPGAGVGHGVGSLHTIGFMGRRLLPFRWASLEQGDNPIASMIPVARVTDMLEQPGASRLPVLARQREDGVTLDLLDLERRGEPRHHLVEQGRDDRGAVLELGRGHEGGDCPHRRL